MRVRRDADGPGENPVLIGCQKWDAAFFLLFLGGDSRLLAEPLAEQAGERVKQEMDRGAGLFAIAERALSRADDGRGLLQAGLGLVDVQQGLQMGVGPEKLRAEVLAEALARECERFQERASRAGARSKMPRGSMAGGSIRSLRSRKSS